MIEQGCKEETALSWEQCLQRGEADVDVRNRRGGHVSSVNLCVCVCSGVHVLQSQRAGRGRGSRRLGCRADLKQQTLNAAPQQKPFEGACA